MAFCDLLQTFHKQVTNVFQHVFVILWWTFFDISPKSNTLYILPSLNSQRIPTMCYVCKGVYPQKDGSLAIVNIDASKGYIDLWVHFFVAVEDIHRNWYRRKWCFLAFDLIQTCLIFPFRWACFPIKIGRNAQWEHLFSMDFDDFSTIYLIF